MNITEALKKGNGKARLSGFDGCYVGEGDDGVLTWFTTLGREEYRVTYDQLVLTAWLPYNAETEKCEACQEADALEGRPGGYSSDYSYHLRKHHCTCKKGGA